MRLIRAAAVAAVAGFTVVAPIRMAQGAPKTRFAIVPTSVTGVRVGAAMRPEVPPAPGPVVDSPFPLSHLGVRWVGSEDAAVTTVSGQLRVAGKYERIRLSSVTGPVAFDGDIDQGKVEVGQSVGLIDELLPAAELVRQLIAEFETAVERLSRFRD